ncbi:MAG: hypothetical protein ACOZIN_22340 [Myxococcota bacterium]
MSSNRISRSISGIHMKFNTHMKRSGEVSAGLRQLPGGAALYDEIQQSERELRASKENLDVKAEALTASRTTLAATRKELVILVRLGVELCEISGIKGARSVLVSDGNDEPAIAAHVAEYVERVPVAGPGLASTIIAKRSSWLAVEEASSQVKEDFERASREYSHVFYRANAAVAQGKALLAVSGLAVPERKVVRRKKKPALAPASSDKAEPLLLIPEVA